VSYDIRVWREVENPYGSRGFRYAWQRRFSSSCRSSSPFSLD
jgi:hypothetical protein